MCSRTSLSSLTPLSSCTQDLACVLLLWNVFSHAFSYYRMCSLTVKCVLLLLRPPTNRIAAATRCHLAVYAPCHIHTVPSSDNAGATWTFFPYNWACVALVAWQDGASALAWHPLALELAVCRHGFSEVLPPVP
jgi:hypothetical protein